MKSNFDYIIIGSSLASLVAASELSKKEKKIALINPSSHWGGHFSPVQIDGYNFDPGMVLYEFDSFFMNIDSRIDSYNPWLRNDSGRFCKKVEAFVSQYISFHSIQAPKMFFNNVVLDDFLIANNLKSLSFLDLKDIECIKAELEGITSNSASNLLHPSLKLKSELFKKKSYYDVSVANHGVTFHEKFIETYCKKVLNLSSREVIALFHRVAWLPLFYPETLLSYINGENNPDLRIKFSYPDKLCATHLTELIFLEIQKSQNITIFESAHIDELTIKNSSYEVLLNQEKKLFSPNLVWGLDSSNLIKILTDKPSNFNYDKSSIGFIFINIPTCKITSKFSVLNVIDRNFSIYRISNQSECSGEMEIFTRLVIEFNLDFFALKYGENLSDEDIKDKILFELFNMNIFLKIDSSDLFFSIKKLKNVLLKPTLENMNNFTNEFNIYCELASDIKLIGPSSGFFASSLNDQIVQGLKISESIS